MFGASTYIYSSQSLEFYIAPLVRQFTAMWIQHCKICFEYDTVSKYSSKHLQCEKCHENLVSEQRDPEMYGSSNQGTSVAFLRVRIASRNTSLSTCQSSNNLIWNIDFIQSDLIPQTEEIGHLHSGTSLTTLQYCNHMYDYILST